MQEEQREHADAGTQVASLAASKAASKVTTMVVQSIVPIPIVGAALGFVVGMFVSSLFGSKPRPIFNKAYWETQDVNSRWLSYVQRCPKWIILAANVNKDRLALCADLFLLWKLSDIANSVTLDRVLTAATEAVRKGDSTIITADVNCYADLPARKYRDELGKRADWVSAYITPTWQKGWLTGFSNESIMGSAGAGVYAMDCRLPNDSIDAISLANSAGVGDAFTNVMLRNEEDFYRFLVYCNNFALTSLGQVMDIEQLITGLIEQAGGDEDMLAMYRRIRKGESKWSRIALGYEHPEEPAQIGWERDESRDAYRERVAAQVAKNFQETKM